MLLWYFVDIRTVVLRSKIYGVYMHLSLRICVYYVYTYLGYVYIYKYTYIYIYMIILHIYMRNLYIYMYTYIYIYKYKHIWIRNTHPCILGIRRRVGCVMTIWWYDWYDMLGLYSLGWLKRFKLLIGVANADLGHFVWTLSIGPGLDQQF